MVDSELTGRTAELILQAALGDPISTAKYEGLCAGNANGLVEGVVVCYAPTLDLLRRAAALKKTLIIGREHPFFLHGGLHYSYGTDGLEAAMKDDPLVRAKREIINANRLMVYRFGAAWDQFKPKAQSHALAQALGLAPIAASPTDRARGVVCNLPRTTMTQLAQTAATRLKIVRPRIVGDPNLTLTRVAVLAGETDPTPALARLLADPKIDGAIAGAGSTVDEVDGAIGYFRDVVGAGRRIALLAVGYGPSHDPGVAEMARWLRGVLPGQTVEWWPTSDPAWIPRQ
jgi:putative NIF3 family GTP cyclohydrolase 1 type 2